MVITTETPLFQAAQLPTRAILPTQAIFRKAVYAPIEEYLFIDSTGQCCYALEGPEDEVGRGPEEDDEDDLDDGLDL